MEFKTGMEGAAFETVEMVNCPVLAAAIELCICRNGRHGSPCNYFNEVRELPRGDGKPPKLVLVCNAPRPITVLEVLAPDSRPQLVEKKAASI